MERFTKIGKFYVHHINGSKEEGGEEGYKVETINQKKNQFCKID